MASSVVSYICAMQAAATFPVYSLIKEVHNHYLFVLPLFKLFRIKDMMIIDYHDHQLLHKIFATIEPIY